MPSTLASRHLAHRDRDRADRADAVHAALEALDTARDPAAATADSIATSSRRPSAIAALGRHVDERARRSGTRPRRGAPTTPRRGRSRRRRRTRRRPSSGRRRPRSRCASLGRPRLAFSEPSIGSMTTRTPSTAEVDVAALLADTAQKPQALGVQRSSSAKTASSTWRSMTSVRSPPSPRSPVSTTRSRLVGCAVRTPRSPRTARRQSPSQSASRAVASTVTPPCYARPSASFGRKLRTCPTSRPPRPASWAIPAGRCSSSRGAGTGKTAVLVERFARLVSDGADPRGDPRARRAPAAAAGCATLLEDGARRAPTRSSPCTPCTTCARGCCATRRWRPAWTRSSSRSDGRPPRDAARAHRRAAAARARLRRQPRRAHVARRRAHRPAEGATSVDAQRFAALGDDGGRPRPREREFAAALRRPRPHAR